jgi:hypothetical protein
MVTPKVTELSALSAHRREVALVRWPLVAVPEPSRGTGKADPRDPLHRIRASRRSAQGGYDSAW